MICKPKYFFVKFIRNTWLLALAFMTITSCNQKETQADGNTADYKRLDGHIDTLFNSNRAAEGMHLLDSIENHADHLTVDDRFSIYWFRYIYYQQYVHNSKKALLYADTLLAIANQSVNNKQYTSLYVTANFAAGDACFTLQKYTEAYQHLFQGYLIGKNSLNRNVLSDYTYRMGMITYKMGNYGLAKDYFIKSNNYYDMRPHDFATFYHKQELIDNIAIAYQGNKQTDSALVYFDKCLTLIEKNAGQFKTSKKQLDMARGVVYGNKAEVYTAKGDYKQATDLLKQSIAINLQPGYDNNDAAIAQTKLAQIYYDNKQDTELFNLLTLIGKQSINFNNPDVAIHWNRLMSDYYIRKKDLSKGLKYLRVYHTVKDSNIQRINLLKQSNVSKQLDNYDKQQQIEQLSDNNKIQRILLFVIIILAIMALIIIMLIYRNWRRSRRDVLTVNLLNQQINNQNAELGKALNDIKLNSQEKDRILRTVAHDLRNPIGGIAALISVMADEDCTDEQKEMINLVKETSYNSLELINEILEATNVNALELHPEPVEINSLVNKSVELLRFKASEKSQQIFFEPLSSPVELLISREKIWRVISNLISNAIKFSPDGAPIFVKVVQENNNIIISVLDNGIGIPDEMKDQVFNMFTTAQRPGTAGEKSFGLGLSICKQIIEKSHGKIWFESSGRGTIFYISLPVPGKNGKQTKSAQQRGIPQAR